VSVGTSVSCGSNSTTTGSGSGGTCNSTGTALSLSCVNPFLAPVSVYTTKSALEAALVTAGYAYADPGTNCNAQGTLGSTVTTSFCTLSNLLYVCSNLFTCGTSSGLSRQAVGQTVITCSYTSLAAQLACLQQAACNGALTNASTCYYNGATNTCPTCGSGSKKGLLGLLGLLGLIPLLLCLLLCCLLLLCCIRRKKTAGAVHFATIDAAQPPLCTGVSMAPMAPIAQEVCVPQPYCPGGVSVYP